MSSPFADVYGPHESWEALTFNWFMASFIEELEEMKQTTMLEF